jgi:hypothetical protein
MGEQIRFFKKSWCDLEREGVTATASQGSDYAAYPLNRSNLSAWVTTDSVDADNTTWTVNFGEVRAVDSILLLKHNFRAFTVKYLSGASWTAFSPAISETTNTAESNAYDVTSVETSQIQITITGTQTANEDKFLAQFIATEAIGQLAGWPQIKSPKHSRNKRRNQMLSGKSYIAEQVGAFSCELVVKELKSAADLAIVEELYDSVDGFLFWPGGGSESQFPNVLRGYRLEDIYLVKPVDDYEPEFLQGQYRRGIDFKMKLAEVID